MNSLFSLEVVVFLFCINAFKKCFLLFALVFDRNHHLVGLVNQVSCRIEHGTGPENKKKNAL